MLALDLSVAFNPHPAVWLLAAGLVGMYVYALRVIGPRAVRGDEVVATRSNRVAFGATVAVLIVAATWPMHDIGEQRLFSVHMFQHMLLQFVLPPLAFWATPTWLARLVVGDGAGYRVVKRLARFIPATLVFNGMIAILHVPGLVNASVENGLLHYGLHVVVVAASFVMWLPVCGPLPELRFPIPAQMGYLFVQSILPTIPGAWLTFATGAVYSAYDQPIRLWGLSLAVDQQMAGLIMKLGGGFFLWTVIAVLFFRFAAEGTEDDRYTGFALDRRAPGARPAPVAARPAPGAAPVPPPEAGLTWDEVERALEAAGPPPPDPRR